jgi:hypothetical protein
MTVQELIDELMHIDNKESRVLVELESGYRCRWEIDQIDSDEDDGAIILWSKTEV